MLQHTASSHATNKQKGSFSLAVSLLMNLWCTVVKPYEMSPRAVPSSLKWPFRIDQAGYGGYPDASTTCWAARKHVTEDVAHISEATGDLSYKSHTHTSETRWATQAHTLTQRPEVKTPQTHAHCRDHERWTGYPSHTQRPKWKVVSHTAKFKYSQHVREHDWTYEHSFTHTYSLIKTLWVKTWKASFSTSVMPHCPLRYLILTKFL